MADKGVPIDKLLYNLLREVTTADAAMQINQLELWREAAKSHPYLSQSDAIAHKDADGNEVRQVMTDLLEGIDRQNNLSIDEVTLELDLERARTPFWEWLRGLFIRKPRRRYYKFSRPTNYDAGKPKVSMKLRVKRRPLGSWEASKETRGLLEESPRLVVPEL